MAIPERYGTSEGLHNIITVKFKNSKFQDLTSCMFSN